jgi:hypothetical protein
MVSAKSLVVQQEEEGREKERGRLKREEEKRINRGKREKERKKEIRLHLRLFIFGLAPNFSPLQSLKLTLKRITFCESSSS